MSDLEDLLDKGISILKREVSSIMLESFEGKLSSESAKDLATYVKLMAELSSKQEDVLKELSDEDLRKLLDEDLQRSPHERTSAQNLLKPKEVLPP